ncbi:MAG: hypothetical protein PS018_28075 [bacterium]|nr:hypothetical protein [bacterium]
MRDIKGPGFAGAFLFGTNSCYNFYMSQTTDKPARVMPSATPSEAELAAWAALPRDEQVRRYQAMFNHPDCNTLANDTPDDILAAARKRVAARRHG